MIIPLHLADLTLCVVSFQLHSKPPILLLHVSCQFHALTMMIRFFVLTKSLLTLVVSPLVQLFRLLINGSLCCPISLFHSTVPVTRPIIYGSTRTHTRSFYTRLIITPEDQHLSGECQESRTSQSSKDVSEKQMSRSLLVTEKLKVLAPI